MPDPFVIGFLLAVLSSVFWASLDITRKHIGEYMTASAAVIGIMLWQIPFIVPFMAAEEFNWVPTFDNPVADIVFVPFPEVTGIYVLFGVGSVILNIAANFLFLRSVQISPLSLTTPYLSFTPVFSAIVAYFTLGEAPTGWGIAGIVTVCIGAFFLNPGAKGEGLLGPLKAIWNERGSMYMLIVAFIWSVTPVIDKEAAGMTSPMWHTLFLAFGVGLAFIVYRLIKDGGASELREELTNTKFWIAACGFFSVGAMAMQLGSYVFVKIAYVETIKRAIGVLSAILAGWVLFKEKDIGRRLVGAVVMIAGVAMVLMTGN
ncbi:MAG: EamA family transporter [Myxococcota bacterium]